MTVRRGDQEDHERPGRPGSRPPHVVGVSMVQLAVEGLHGWRLASGSSGPRCADTSPDRPEGLVDDTPLASGIKGKHLGAGHEEHSPTLHPDRDFPAPVGRRERLIDLAA
jgi:hypothetical protein